MLILNPTSELQKTFNDPFFTDWTWFLQNAPAGAKYPPHSVLDHGNGRLSIELAVAGFSPDMLSVEIIDNLLVVKGSEPPKKPIEMNSGSKILYGGIARRSFERKFDLQDRLRVIDTTIKDGILTIDLEQVIPEHLKPRKLEIRSI